ncbi:pro-sigmaK processing inhibitor BofA family protein [Thalassobacillus sp. CUG 92003]|uniref:pro-sigmaK processing inhibitor BofA family protein n=1 Tax=Thalassobacillus sp. CUG 92003 TaxID=2736641 RepID=UPI0015E7713D|nr:pro-sigmaK processing inhibitor BofA family protein [Thalassobacillus sp. CUG 92003]
MDPILIILILALAIPFLLVVGMPAHPVRWLGQAASRVVIGVLLLFFLNVLGAGFGLHVPINVFTAVVSGILGLPGILSLSALHLWVI